MKQADIFSSRFVRCAHTHLSGRRCANQISKGGIGRPKLCPAHLGSSCAECANMRGSFVPPKGW